MATAPSIPDIAPKHVRLLQEDPQAVVDAYHEMVYPIQGTSWMGHELLKNPCDLWMYQQIIYRHQPDLIIETGTFKGGSAYYLAHLCELVNHGVVITIDVNRWPSFPRHDRIMYLQGSSVSEEILAILRSQVSGCSKVMAILDSDHTEDHVAAELKAYSEFVTLGQYLIVEDTDINGHPVRLDFGPGPYEAVMKFLKEDNRYAWDRGCEPWFMTQNPHGYLRRVK